MSLVFDGVTLTKAPAILSGRQKHAAQAVKHMWMTKNQKPDPDILTHNRYGPQLGQKVPLWGGFTGTGEFPMKFWTPRSKMTRPEWLKLLPKMKRCIDQAGAPVLKRPKVWHDNEKFLQAPSSYRSSGMESVRFPPNSGDLNPIETVWARLRKDLATREFEDLQAGKLLSVSQYRQRVAQILNSYSVTKLGQKHCYYQKLIRGMPARLQQCKQNRYGPCGK